MNSIDEPGPVDRELTDQGVFESILVRHGKIIRLAAHLARLDRSCRELYGHGVPDDLARRISREAPGDQHRLAIRVQARPERSLADHPQATGHSAPAWEVDAAPMPRRAHLAAQMGRPRRLTRPKVAVRPALPYFTSPARPELITETSRGNLFLLRPTVPGARPRWTSRCCQGSRAERCSTCLMTAGRRRESGVAQWRSYATHAARSGPAASAERFRSLPSMGHAPGCLGVHCTAQ